MRFAVFKGEESVTDLANRLFRLRGRGVQTAIKQAAEALLKANPQLKDLSKLPAGSLISVPDTAPPLRPGEGVAAPGPAPTSATDRAQNARTFLDQRLSAIEAMAAEKLKSGIERLQAADWKAASKIIAQQNPDLAKMMPDIATIVNNAKQMLKDLQAAPDSRNKAVEKRAAPSSPARTSPAKT